MRLRVGAGEPDTSAGAEAPSDSASAVANCPALPNRLAASISVAVADGPQKGLWQVRPQVDQRSPLAYAAAASANGSELALTGCCPVTR